jgi:hypothetical protein
MAHASGMSSDTRGSVSVIDFRRHGMVLEWHVLGGTWTAYDEPPSLVHGIAMIRAGQPNICVYSQGGQLRLQVGPSQYPLSGNSIRLKCSRGFGSLSLRRRFTVTSSAGSPLFTHAYWISRGEDFFRWLATRDQDPRWRETVTRLWSEGVSAAVLRSA